MRLSHHDVVALLILGGWNPVAYHPRWTQFRKKMDSNASPILWRPHRGHWYKGAQWEAVKSLFGITMSDLMQYRKEIHGSDEEQG